MRRFLRYPVPLWKLLVLLGVVALLYLASAPGCTNVATIANRTKETANVTLTIRETVVWRGSVAADTVIRAQYRIVGDGVLGLKADFAQSSVQGAGSEYMMVFIAPPELFFIQSDRVSSIGQEGDVGELEAVLIGALSICSCVVQSVLDLTGAPDPAKLK